MVRSGQALLILPQELSIMNAPLLRDAFLKVLPECQSLDVDLTAVKEADLAGLQVLCSAASTFHAHGKTISATGPIPENIVSLAKEIGFQEDSCGDSSLFFI
jgi:ABC-type transporter Mla MlaB component